MTLRRITALSFPDIVEPDLGLKPELLWVAPTDLWVDPTYQRDLTVRSYKLLKRVLKQFSWNRMKPPIAARAEDGQIHLIDGQHTAIAAASLNIPAIPVFIVAAEALHERARSFVSHNTNRVAVQPLAVYKALVAAGDPEALVCEAVIKKAGVRFRVLNQSVAPKVGDCSSFSVVQNMVKTHGPMRTRIVLETLVQAERAPISGHDLRATVFLLWQEEPRIDPGALAEAIKLDSDMGFLSAQMRAKQAHMVLWRALAERWRRKVNNAQAAA
jgi:hypothetical protein